jgi:hypothetical protein
MNMWLKPTSYPEINIEEGLYANADYRISSSDFYD